VLEQGGTEDEAIAGLLHDGVDDQGGKPTLALPVAGGSDARRRCLDAIDRLRELGADEVLGVLERADG
jgi:hypothetical protein